MKHFGTFRLDTANECLWHNGEQIALPPKPFALLRYLVENAGRLVTHDELLNAVWPQVFVQPQVLRTYVLELRKLLGDEAGQPQYIQTLPKRGYRFLAAVTDHEGRHLAPVLEAKAPPVVGREHELAQLHAQAKALPEGARKVVVLIGEPGIGKTVLVDHFCRELAASQQFLLARGQCVEGFSVTEEYYPVMEALGELCACTVDGEMACRTLARYAPAWIAALGRELPADVGALPPSRERVPGDLCAALEELSMKKPLVLVFEDLQWADDSTLGLISALARRRAPARLMVLATCGQHDLPGAHPWSRLKQDLLLRQLSMSVPLGPLNRTAISEMLRRKLGQEHLPAGLVSFVHQHSEGNPLFANAIVEHLTAQGFLVRRERGGQVQWEQSGSFEDNEAAAPAGLAQMIELEVRRLAPTQQRILEAASLMGLAFPVWAVAAALEQDVAVVEEACDELARHLYFVRRAGEDELPDGSRSSFYVFAHGLYREVLYRRQSAVRRATGHARIARRLSELFAGREANVAREVAMHYEAAGEWAAASHALRTAAAYALHRKASAEAAELLDRAVRLAEKLSDKERPEVLRAISSQMDAVRVRS